MVIALRIGPETKIPLLTAIAAFWKIVQVSHPDPEKRIERIGCLGEGSDTLIQCDIKQTRENAIQLVRICVIHQ
jgi:hypothetical protein